MRWTGANPNGSGTVPDTRCEITGTEHCSTPTATQNPQLPRDLEEQLYGEIRRLHAGLERLQDQPTGEEFANLVHQLHGLAGLYGLDELDATVRDLKQAVRNNLPRSIAPALQRLAAIIASLPQPTECRS